MLVPGQIPTIAGNSLKEMDEMEFLSCELTNWGETCLLACLIIRDTSVDGQGELGRALCQSLHELMSIRALVYNGINRKTFTCFWDASRHIKVGPPLPNASHVFLAQIGLNEDL